LGDYYYSGYQVNKNLHIAKNYYEKAALNGNSQGMINLGLMYQKGLIDTPKFNH
jgi:TPR repeat protein